MYREHLLLLSLSILNINGYKHFQARIPNGDKVVNPCDNSTIWSGVGHFAKDGGGKRNPFGKVCEIYTTILIFSVLIVFHSIK